MKRTNKSFVCLVLSALTVSLIITALLYKASPLFTTKPLFLCQKVISNIMLEVPGSLSYALILITGVVLTTGLLSFLVQLVKTRNFVKKLLTNRADMSSDLTKLLESLNLENKVILVKDRNLHSFCYGIFSPFILITTGIVKSLTHKELEAVLLHEQSHLLRRDPSKVLIGKTFSSMFFFLPIFRELHKNIEAVNELLADQWTISRQKNSSSLRGALKKILAAPQFNFVVSNVSNPDYFEIRIHRLINPGTKHKFRLSLLSLVTTFLFILVSWFLLQTPVSAFHTDSKNNSTYFLCSVDQSCSKQCHPDTEQPSNYIPTHLFLPEKRCDDNSKGVSHSSSASQILKYQPPVLNHFN